MADKQVSIDITAADQLIHALLDLIERDLFVPDAAPGGDVVMCALIAAAVAGRDDQIEVCAAYLRGVADEIEREANKLVRERGA